ncbi:MAG TPA: enoyl-CoA hydratase family protein [Burkholderiales bacterium]|nr:enoyl-CoA hydratase family protein [Burkholderiales bacterium]
MNASNPPAARLLEDRRERVLLVTISNPALRNALGPDVYRAAKPLFEKAGSDDGIGAIVLAGEGEHFCGGGNLNRLKAQRSLPADAQQQSLDAFHAWILAMQDCPKPVIAAVEGAAAGGGFSLALACDLIVAAEDARFVMSYAKIGLSPDGGGSDSLARSLAPQTALEILLAAQPVSAARLHALGIVNRVVARGTALAAALQWAERLAAGPSLAHAAAKRLVYEARGRSRTAQLDAERDAFLQSLYSDECAEGIAAFLDKRAPRFHS